MKHCLVVVALVGLASPLVPAHVARAAAPTARPGAPAAKLAAPDSARPPGEAAPAADLKPGHLGEEYLRDAPPPTLWDRRHEDPNILAGNREKVGDNQSLLMQLVRTIVALCGVLFLLWAFARVIGPRLGRALGGKRAIDMQVTDRLNLDGRNTLVRVTLASGQSYLIACGDHDIKLIDKLPAPAGPDAPAAFATRMGAQAVPEE